MDDDVRDGVTLTNLDQPLFDGAGATKRDLVDYLRGVSDLLVEALRDRPLSVIRARPGQQPFMQKNLPKGTPDWVQRVTWFAETSQRNVTYALGNDRATLTWFANQRAVEYHPTLVTASDPSHMTFLVLDLDPPEGSAFDHVVAVAMLVRTALDAVGLQGAVKTSGAKGVHVFVPVDATAPMDDAAAALRALAARVAALDPSLATTAFMKEDRGGRVFVDATRVGGATVVAPYSPRIRPGVPVSFPVQWDELARIAPTDFTVSNALALLAGRPSWSESMPAPQRIPDALVAEGRSIPVPRVAAMHEGKRRKRNADST